MHTTIRKQLIAMAKTVFYGLIIICSLACSLIAEDLKGQSKSMAEVRLSITAKNESLESVFEIIERKTNFHFSYFDKHVESGQVTISFRNEPLINILQEISEQTLLSFKRVNNNINVLRSDKTPSVEEVIDTLEKTEISGTITDESGQGLPGASIVEKGTANGTTTNVEGKYSLTVEQGSIVVVSFIGYETQEITIGSQTQIDIQLNPDVTQLEEIVVVGYGTQKKSDLTGSISIVGQERLELVPNVNFAQALRAASPGLFISNNNAGAEGGDIDILIRGRNSILGQNKPFIVLDGIPYTGDISEINPVDIESMSVLRDASSVAIYGTRGANGVILITTKSGITEKPRFNYSAFYGVAQISNYPEPMTGSEFAEFKEEREPGTMTLSELDVLNSGNEVDWVDLATQVGVTQQHSLSVTGGTEKTKYFVSGTILDKTGIAVNDEFKRYSLRVNLDQDLSTWLTVGTHTQLSLSDRSGRPAQFSGEHGAYTMNPLTSPYEEDGSYTIHPWPEDPFFRNPLNQTLADDEDKTYKVFTNNYINIQLPFVPGLSYKLNTGIEYTSLKRDTYFGRNTTIGFSNQGQSDSRNRVNTNVTVENIVNYEKTFGIHKLNLTGLYSFQNQDYDEKRYFGTGYATDLLTHRQLQNATVITSFDSKWESTNLSQMLRVNYVYDDRFLATFTARRDGYSGFGVNTKYGFFPSAALAWNINNEDFFQGQKLFSTMKLRASYGKNGNQAIPPYETISLYFEQNYVYGSQSAPGYIAETVGKDDLSWETNTSLNIGLDYGLLEGRIQGTMDFYQANISDMLLEAKIPSVTGHDVTTANIAEARNTGFELGLGVRAIDEANFSWDIDMNFSYNKNEIVDLPGGVDDVANKLFIGRPILQNYALQFDGIWQTDDDFTSTFALDPNADPGDVKVADVNGSGSIETDEDRTFLGQKDPKHLWGVNSTMTFKNFTLNVFVHGVHGITRPFELEPNVWTGVRRNTFAREYWTDENRSNSVPANRQGVNPYGVQDYYSADFIRLKDVTLAYDLPNDVLNKMGLTLFKVYVNARNLATITDWPGIDPELDGVTQIPLQREFIVGLNLGF